MRLQGWVLGSFQEASKGLHHLLECLADSELRPRGLARGREGGEWERRLQEGTQPGGCQGCICLSIPHTSDVK